MPEEKPETPPTFENPHGPPQRHPGGGPIPVEPNAQLDGDDVANEPASGSVKPARMPIWRRQ